MRATSIKLETAGAACVIEVVRYRLSIRQRRPGATAGRYIIGDLHERRRSATGTPLDDFRELTGVDTGKAATVTVRGTWHAGSNTAIRTVPIAIREGWLSVRSHAR